MRNLLVDRSATAISLAASFAALADPQSDSANNPRFWPGIRSAINFLEAQNCAVFRHGGVSWDALGSFYGVSKQSLHRRLSTQVDKVMESAQKYPGLYEPALILETSVLGLAATTSAEGLHRAAASQAQVWDQRRHAHTWWWSERG